jgi:hypothetical protein
LEKLSTLENEGISVDVVENTCRKNVTSRVSVDVSENKRLPRFVKILMKTNGLVKFQLTATEIPPR